LQFKGNGVRLRSGSRGRLPIRFKKVNAKGSEWECGIIAAGAGVEEAGSEAFGISRGRLPIRFKMVNAKGSGSSTATSSSQEYQP
jgi:hypothetical protein